MAEPDFKTELYVDDRAALRNWLLENAGSATSVWLVRPHKSQPDYMPMSDIVQECLAHGWVDSSVRKRDEISSWLRISPRREGSAWSAVNKRNIARLRKEGLMTSRGEALIERAKADGSWTFLDDVEALIVPDDLAAALDATPTARNNYEAFPRSNKRAILEWIKQAKTAPTRRKRITETARLAAKNVRALTPEARNA